MDIAQTRGSTHSARIAVTVIFLVHGLLLAAWAPHIATIKDRLEMSDGLLGWVLLCMAGGALCAMQLMGRLIDRFGSRPVLMVSTLIYCVLVNGPLHAGSPVELAVALFLFGCAAGSMDVAMNAHGAAVETRHGRPCMSSMHGAFSVGALIGAGFGAVMLGMDFAPWQHTLASTVLAFGMAAVSFLFLLPAAIDRGVGPRTRVVVTRTIIILGMLGAIAMLAEGAMIDWSAVYMRDVVGVDVAREGWAFAGFSAAMAVIRVAGDRMSLKFGRQRLFKASAAIAIVGCLIMASLPGLITGVLGATLVGIGVANCVPLVFAAAARTGTRGSAGGLAVVAGLSYCGFLIGPPVVGGLSELFSLRLALAIIAGLLVVLLIARLPGTEPGSQSR